MPIWEISNPSDPYTIKHDRFEAAAAATLILGAGAYGLSPVDDDAPRMPIFLLGGHESFLAEHFGDDLPGWIEANEAAVAEAMDSVLLGGSSRRADYEAAASAIDDPAKLRVFRDQWQGRHTSLNNIGARAHTWAAESRDNADIDKVRTQHPEA